MKLNPWPGIICLLTEAVGRDARILLGAARRLMSPARRLLVPAVAVVYSHVARAPRRCRTRALLTPGRGRRFVRDGTPSRRHAPTRVTGMPVRECARRVRDDLWMFHTPKVGRIPAALGVFRLLAV